MHLITTVGFVESCDTVLHHLNGMRLGLSTDVINTTMEYEEMIAGNVPQDEYLQVRKRQQP